MCNCLLGSALSSAGENSEKFLACLECFAYLRFACLVQRLFGLRVAKDEIEPLPLVGFLGSSGLARSTS